MDAGVHTQHTAGPASAASAASAAGAANGPVLYTLLVEAGRQTPRGTYEITYYACDRQYLTPATVTVTVTKSQKLTARKLTGRPGVVRSTNPGPQPARAEVREFDRALEPGRRQPLIARRMPAETTRTLRPHVRSIEWSAFSRRGPGGFGVIGGIGRPPSR